MRLRKLGMGLLALGLVGLIGTTALAQPPGKGKPGGKGKEAGKKDKMKFKGKFGDKGRYRGHWGGSFGRARGGFAHRGHRGHHRHWGRYAFGPRGYRGRFAGHGHRGHRGRHAWARGARFGWHAHRGHGHHGRFGRPGRTGRFGPGWGRPGRSGRFGWGRPGLGGRFGGKGFAGKGAFAMGSSRGGLLKSLKLTEEQQKKLADLRKSEAAAIKKALEARRDEMRKSLKGILTAEQFKKLEEATKRFRTPSKRGVDKGNKDKKPKDDVEASVSPATPAARDLVAIALPAGSRLTREAATRFARRE